LELILADLQTVSKKLSAVKKDAKGAHAKEMAKTIEILEKVNAQLEAEKPARELTFDEEELAIVKDLHLLTMKPMLYVLNVDEAKTSSEIVTLAENTEQIEICARLEAELADLSPVEAQEYLNSLGLKETGLDKLIRAGYKLLDLVTFLTSGEPETRAWTVKRNTKAPDAAGVIHTDFIKGFVKADVVDWKDFVAFGGWGEKLKESGKIKLVGKDYVIQDGDVVYFHVNV